MKHIRPYNENNQQSEFSEDIDYEISLDERYPDNLEWEFTSDINDEYGATGEINLGDKSVSFFIENRDYHWHGTGMGDNILENIDGHIHLIEIARKLIQCFPNGSITNHHGDIHWKVPFVQFSRKTRMKLESLS